MIKRFYLKVFVLSFILWAFFPIRRCWTRLSLDTAKLTYYHRISQESTCHWTTIGLGVIKEWIEFGLSDKLFMYIITIFSFIAIFFFSLLIVWWFYHLKCELQKARI